MARVQLSSSLMPYTGGRTEVDLDAGNVLELLDRLAELFPDLRTHLEHGVAVAIDGVIYQDALLQPIERASEIFLIDRIVGG